MLNKTIFLIILLVLTVLSSCEKVIQLDLKDSEQQIVIEGEINADDSVHTVLISKSIKFSEENMFPGISGANVTISDNLGNSESLIEVSNGKYQTTNLKGIEGRTYTLSVVIDGKTYTSNSTIPNKSSLFGVSFIPSGISSDGGMIAIPNYANPAGIQDNFRFDMWIKRNSKNENWVRDSAIIIQDDQFSDGLMNQQPIFGTIQAYYSGDSCRTTFMCIDRNVFKYFYSLQLNGPNGSATPANPVSNITGGCLGYFSAQTKQTITFKVE